MKLRRSSYSTHFSSAAIGICTFPHYDASCFTDYGFDCCTKLSSIALFPNVSSSKMRIKDLNRQQAKTVPCPTCGASVGHSCLLYAGAARKTAHVDRKFLGVETIQHKGATNGSVSAHAT
jgi:hypothetical protein